MSRRKAELRPGDHIIELGLNNRAYNALVNAGIVTIGTLTKLTPSALLKIDNLGATSQAHIYRMLEAAGLALATDPALPEPPPPGTSLAELKIACQSAYTQLLTAQIRFRRAEAALGQALADELGADADWQPDEPIAYDPMAED